MENSQSNSFIPKTPVRGTVNKRRGVRKVYVLSYLTFVLFFGTLIATAGTFFYNLTVAADLVAQKDLLSEQRSTFSQSDLERVRDLDARMNMAQNILSRHVSVHSVFSALESTTLRPVELTNFSYIKEEDGLKLSLGANMPDFNTALFQREKLRENSILKGAIISGITYETEVGEQEGTIKPNVTFTVEKILSPDEIPYVAAASFTNSTAPEISGSQEPVTESESSVTATQSSVVDTADVPADSRTADALEATGLQDVISE